METSEFGPLPSASTSVHKMFGIIGSKPGVKLSPAEVLCIFKKKGASSTASAVSRFYGVSEKTIRDIWNGRTWAKETWHLDTSRILCIKLAGRPKGRKDSRPRKKRSDQHQATSVSDPDSQTSFSCTLPLASSKSYTGLSRKICNPVASNSHNPPHKSSNIGERGHHTLDDQLFYWTLAAVDDPRKADPFLEDWASFIGKRVL